MAILSNTELADKTHIKTAFLPFARPDYVEGMLIGDDLDSLLSAMYLHRRFGWAVSAVYCKYSKIWYNGSAADFQRQFYTGRIFAVDLDIYHPCVPSLGHHIIALEQSGEMPGHSHSLNPNAIRGFSVQQHFSRKYPLATIHFLRWLFDENDHAFPAEMLTWLADSSYINAQHYRENVAEWVAHCFSLPALVQMLPALQTQEYEQALLENILLPMSQNPLCHPGHSGYKSRHLGLSGFQCQFEHPNKQNSEIQSLLDLLSKLSAWPRLPFPSGFEGGLEGKRRQVRVSELRASGMSLGDWLDTRGVFSYAFTFKDRMNYTVI